MKRAVLTIFLVFCVATLFAEATAISWLVLRGDLTRENVREIRMILKGEDPRPLPLPAEAEKSQISGQEVMKERVNRLFEIEARNRELDILKGILATQATNLTAEQERFDKKKKDFEEELRLMNSRLVAEATEQTRGVLLAMPAQAAARHLLELPLDQNVVLLKGMPEKSIARILQEFQGDDKQLERARKILDALSLGAPLRKVVDSAMEPSATTRPETTEGRPGVTANAPLSVAP